MKSYRLHDSIYLAFWKRQNYSMENRTLVDRVRDGGGNDYKKLFCLWIVVVAVYESIHVKIHNAIYQIKVNFTIF